MGRNGAKAGGIYIGLYMSIFMGKGFSYPLKVFLIGALYFELPKGLVICFGGALALLLLDATRASRSYLLHLDLGW